MIADIKLQAPKKIMNNKSGKESSTEPRLLTNNNNVSRTINEGSNNIRKVQPKKNMINTFNINGEGPRIMKRERMGEVHTNEEFKVKQMIDGIMVDTSQEVLQNLDLNSTKNKGLDVFNIESNPHDARRLNERRGGFQTIISSGDNEARVAANMDYFGDEEAQLINRQNKDDIYYYSDSEINFSMSQYAEFFFYHLLYFLLFGPFVGLIILVKPSTRFILYNMEFIRPNVISVLQAFYWLLTTFIAVGFTLNKINVGIDVGEEGKSVFDNIMIKTVFTSIILRTTSIAGKYATYPRLLVKKYKEVKIDKQTIQQEFMLIGWLAHEQDVRMQQIKNSIERLEIDKSTFVISYMTFLNDKCKSSLVKLLEGRQENMESSKQVEISRAYFLNSKNFLYYNADLIFEYLVVEFGKRQKYLRGTLFGVVLGVLWSLTPSFLRLSYGQNFHGESVYEIIATYTNMMVSSFLFYVQYMFFFQAVVDLSRKYFIMGQLSYMISPRMLKQYNQPKLIPTISILDPLSLQAWYNLRRMALDYGRKYFYRHEIFLPVNLFLLFINIMVFFAYLFLTTKDISESTIEIKKILFSCVIDGSLFMWVSFHFMYNAGKLNDEFITHMTLVEHNRSLIAGLLKLKHYYFSEYISGSNYIGKDMKQIIPESSQSSLHVAVIREVVLMIGHKFKECEYPEEMLTRFLQEIIDEYDKLSDDLQRFQSIDQVKILGFGVQKLSVLNFAFAVVSGIFTIYQLLIGQ